MAPPDTADSHDARGAKAFASWYVRWLLYAYVAKTTKPLAKYSHECAYCDGAIKNVKEALTNDESYQGDIFATKSVKIKVHPHSSTDVIVKWAIGKFSIKTAEGDLVRKFDGGEGYYRLSLAWHRETWTTRRIVTIKI